MEGGESEWDQDREEDVTTDNQDKVKDGDADQSLPGTGDDGDEVWEQPRVKHLYDEETCIVDKSDI